MICFARPSLPPVTEIKMPVGTRMPFMSSRENGKPVTLRDVLWAGDEPISAYVFEFASKGRRYRCVTPRPCSNFSWKTWVPRNWRSLATRRPKYR